MRKFVTLSSSTIVFNKQSVLFQNLGNISFPFTRSLNLLRVGPVLVCLHAVQADQSYHIFESRVIGQDSRRREKIISHYYTENIISSQYYN